MPHEVDVHPDELLHRARGAGALSPDEQAYVDAHVQDCGTCRFLLDAGRAFDAEAAVASPVKLDRLIARTLQRTGMDRGRRSRQSSRRLAVAGLSAAVMLGGVAFAGFWGVRHPAREAAPLAVSAAPARAARSAPRPAKDDWTPHEDFPAVADLEPAPARSLPTALPDRRIALTRAPRPPETAAALFAAANRARRGGDAAAAGSAYDELWASFRASPEAVASRAIYARWMLDRGLPSVAIPLYREYLAANPAGSLAEEALVGLAVAQERVGQRAGATATWRRLLAEHPMSVHAARARERLRVLDGRTVP